MCLSCDLSCACHVICHVIINGCLPETAKAQLTSYQQLLQREQADIPRFWLKAPCPCLCVSLPLSSFSRPLLVILDRNIDLATPLHHTWTYQALVHDVMVRRGRERREKRVGEEGGE